MVDKSEKFTWLARLGFAARGLVYLLIGYLFLTGDRQRAGDGGPESAFNRLGEVPGGSVVLYLTALGLAGYGLYRLAAAVLNAENQPHDMEGTGRRIGFAASALGHGVLAYSAFQFAQGSQVRSSGSAPEEAAGTLLSFSFGPLIVGLVGIGFLVGALAQGKDAYTAGFMDLVSRRAPPFIEPLGRMGHAARAVVFALIGWSLVQSAWLDSGSQVMTLGEAVASLSRNEIAYTLVALGLLLFGVFSLFLARYRIIPDLDGGPARLGLRKT